MKGPLSIVALVLSLLIVQTTLAPSLISVVGRIPGMGFLAGHTFDFALICLVYLIFHRGWLGALLWGAFFGILGGSFGVSWRGATAVSFFALVLLGTFIKRQILLESRLSVVLLIGGFTLLEGLLHLGSGQLFSRIPDPFSSQWGIIATQAALNAAVAIPLYSFLSYFDELVGERISRERRALLLET